MIARLVAVGLGGCVGALLRYGLSGWIQRRAAGDFPAGTLAVNVLGCLAIGLISHLAMERGDLAPNTRLFLTVGILGAFTTFSTFGVETIDLLGQGARGVAFASVAANVLLGLGAVLAGRALGQMIWPGAPLAG